MMLCRIRVSLLKENKMTQGNKVLTKGDTQIHRLLGLVTDLEILEYWDGGDGVVLSYREEKRDSDHIHHIWRPLYDHNHMAMVEQGLVNRGIGYGIGHDEEQYQAWALEVDHMVYGPDKLETLALAIIHSLWPDTWKDLICGTIFEQYPRTTH